MYVFGSFINGTNTEDSDIDIAVIVDEKIRYEDELEAMKLRRGIDLRIEPHIFSTEDVRNNNPFIEEIAKTGIRI